jgi:hypothetical protein
MKVQKMPKRQRAQMKDEIISTKTRNKGLTREAGVRV